jgi:hypothetical protein
MAGDGDSIVDPHFVLGTSSCGRSLIPEPQLALTKVGARASVAPPHP